MYSDLFLRMLGDLAAGLCNSTLLHNTTAAAAAMAAVNNSSGQCGSMDAFGAPTVLNTTYYIGGQSVLKE